MTTERQAILDAATMLCKLQNKGTFRSYDSRTDGNVETVLRNAVAQAQQNLDEFLASKAARIALDALLPGWRHVDVSDHLPRDLWHAFVSNDPAEWEAWLVEHGIEKQTAARMVKEKFR